MMIIFASDNSGSSRTLLSPFFISNKERQLLRFTSNSLKSLFRLAMDSGLEPVGIC